MVIRTSMQEKEIKEFIASLPNAVQRNDGEREEVTFDCHDTFEANNIEEAKQIVRDKYHDIEFFDCKDEKGNTVFTEED